MFPRQILETFHGICLAISHLPAHYTLLIQVPRNYQHLKFVEENHSNTRLYPCSTKRREGLENPSPTPKISRDPRDFPRAKPEGNLEGRGKSWEISRGHGFCTPRPEGFPEGNLISGIPSQTRSKQGLKSFSYYPYYFSHSTLAKHVIILFYFTRLTVFFKLCLTFTPPIYPFPCNIIFKQETGLLQTYIEVHTLQCIRNNTIFLKYRLVTQMIIINR